MKRSWYKEYQKDQDPWMMIPNRRKISPAKSYGPRRHSLLEALAWLTFMTRSGRYRWRITNDKTGERIYNTEIP